MYIFICFWSSSLKNALLPTSLHGLLQRSNESAGWVNWCWRKIIKQQWTSREAEHGPRHTPRPVDTLVPLWGPARQGSQPSGLFLTWLWVSEPETPGSVWVFFFFFFLMTMCFPGTGQSLSLRWWLHLCHLRAHHLQPEPTKLGGVKLLFPRLLPAPFLSLIP